MSKSERLWAFIWRSSLFGPLFGGSLFTIPFLINRQLQDPLNAANFFYENLFVFIMGSYFIGIIPAFLASWFVGKRVIYFNENDYVYLIIIPPFMLMAVAFVLSLLSLSVIAIVIALFMVIPMIFSSFICRYLFRKYLLEPTHD